MRDIPCDLPFDAPAVERGIGFFETVLVNGRRAALWAAHVDRLVGTMAHFQLPAPTRDEIEAQAAAALDGEAGEQALRLSWLAVGKHLDERADWRLDVSTRAIPPTTLRRRKGSHAITLPAEFTRDMPRAKSTSYLSAALGLREAMRRGGDEGLFIDGQGAYLEGTAAGLAAWNQGRVITPSDGVLPSVTVAAFIASTPAAFRPIGLDELRQGAILLGSLTCAAPLLSIDGQACEVPPALAERMREFNDELLRTATVL